VPHPPLHDQVGGLRGEHCRAGHHQTKIRMDKRRCRSLPAPPYPLGRVGGPQDVAAVAMLASLDAAWITGHTCSSATPDSSDVPGRPNQAPGRRPTLERQDEPIRGRVEARRDASRLTRPESQADPHTGFGSSAQVVRCVALREAPADNDDDNLHRHRQCCSADSCGCSVKAYAARINTTSPIQVDWRHRLSEVAR
jgi:hypothetical protein